MHFVVLKHKMLGTGPLRYIPGDTWQVNCNMTYLRKPQVAAGLELGKCFSANKLEMVFSTGETQHGLYLPLSPLGLLQVVFKVSPGAS